MTFCGSATRALVGPGAVDGGALGLLRGPYGGSVSGDPGTFSAAMTMVVGPLLLGLDGRRKRGGAASSVRL